MPQDRDPVDDAIEKVGAAVAAGLIGILIAAVIGANRRKQMEDRLLKNTLRDITRSTVIAASLCSETRPAWK